MHIRWKNKPSKQKGYHYEFQLGASDKVWKNWDAFVTATKAKELFWAPGTGNSGPTWIAKDLKIKLVANPGYELKFATGKAVETPVTSLDVSKFSSFERFITKKIVDELIDVFDKQLRVTGDTHAMSWSTGDIINFIKNHGFWPNNIRLGIVYSGEPYDDNTYKTWHEVIGWKKMPSEYFNISQPGYYRTLSMYNILDWVYHGEFVADPSAKSNFILKNSGFDTLPMYIDTTSVDMNPELSGTTIKLNDWTEKNSPLRGYTPDFLYSIDNGQHWITKDELIKLYDGSDVNKNLWTPGTKTEKGKWLASTNGNILVKLKPAQHTVLSTDKRVSFPLSSFKKLLKFIPDATADSMLSQIQKDVKTDGGNNNKVKWKPIQAIIDFAENAGLLIEFAKSKDGKYSSDLPEQIEPDPSKRQLWVRINPKPGFTLSTKKTQNNKTNITSTSDLFRIKQEVDVTSVDLSKFELEGDTINLTWKNKPAKQKGYHYEFKLIATASGKKDTAWFTWDQLVLQNKTKKLLYQSGTLDKASYWIRDKIAVKLVANNGYILKFSSSKKPAIESDSVTLDIKKMKVKKEIDLEEYKKLIAWLQGANGIKAGGTHSKVTWSNLTRFKEIIKNLNLSGLFSDGNISHDLPTKLDFWAKNRKLEVVIAVPKEFVILPPPNFRDWNTINITDASGVKKVPTYIDTTQVNTGSIKLTGTTIKLDDWVESNNLSYPTKVVDYAYSIDQGKTWLTKKELYTKYSANNESVNLWVAGTINGSGHWIDGSNGELLVKLVPHVESGQIYKLSSDKRAALKFSSFTKLLKYIPLSTFNAIVNLAKDPIKGILPDPSSLHNKITWLNIDAIMKFAQFAGFKLSFWNPLIKSSSNDLKWVDKIPTETLFDHDKRELYIKAKPLDGFTTNSTVSSKNGVINLTQTSKIRSILSAVNILSKDLKSFKLTGDTHAMKFVSLPTEPKGSKLEFSLDNGKNWMEKQKFISELKAKPSAYIPSHFKVRFNEIDKKKFKLTDGSGKHIDKETNIDVSLLYLYKNVSTFKTIMKTATGIELSGQLSAKNGVQVKIGKELTPSELEKKGIKMQYTLDGTTWIDVPALSNIPADPSTGITGGPNSFKITIAKPKKGLPILSFRLTPFKDWDGKAVSNPKNSDYNEWTKLTKVHLSDFVEAGNKVDAINVSKSKEASQLPTLVNTNTSYLKNISISGDTRHIVIGKDFGNVTIADALKKLNPISTFNFEQFIQPTFALNSKEGKGHWLLREDFVDWLNGNIKWNGKNAVNSKNEAIKVWEDGSEKYTDLKQQDIKPKWNDLRAQYIKVRWNSNNKLYRPTNRDQVLLNEKSKKAKTWIDLTSYAKRLKTLSITGNTNNLVSPELLTIKKELDSNFGLDTFMILSTGEKLANGGFNFQKNYATNGLPSEINFKKELGFKILNGKGSDANNFIASKESETKLKEVFVEWGKSTATQIDKFIHVNKKDLATKITLSGTTKDLNVLIKPELLKSNVNGVLDANGTYEGLEIYFSLVNVKGANTNAMPLDVFIEYLANKLVLSGSDVKTSKGLSVGSLYSFDKNNYKVKYDGTWGTDNIRVQYKVKATYTILKSEKGPVQLSDDSRKNVKRYLDISSLVKEAEKIKVTGDSTLGWWNKATGKYDLKNKWNGYIDNKKLKWSVAETKIVNPNLYVNILYSVENNVWIKTLPTTIADKNTERHISFKYVWNQKQYNVESGVVISDTKVHDITSSSGIQDVLTYVDIKSADLTKVQIIGDSRHGITVDKSKANLPNNTHLEFSISNFKDFDWSDSSDLGVKRLKELGLKEGHKLLKDLDSSMTKKQFIDWMINLFDKTQHNKLDGTWINHTVTAVQIKRSWISIRIVANAGYSIRQTEDASKRVNGLQNPSTVDKFFSIIEVSEISNKFDKINFFGQQTVADGVIVSLPSELTETNLLKKRMKLQYSLIPSADKDELKEGIVEWNDIHSKNIPANTVKGQVSDVQNGFRVTITPFKKGESFFWVRLVPIVDNLSTTPITNDTVSNKTKHNVEWYENQTHTYLNELSISDWVRTSIRLDTSKIPIVVNTNSKDLKLIGISGDTYNINIFEDIDGLGPDQTPLTSKIAAINKDSSLQTKVLVKYTIDYINGEAIKKSVSNEIEDKTLKPIWLNKTDFESYLSGKLKVAGKLIVYKIAAGSKRVGDKINMESSEMQNWIASRKWKDNDTISPIYNNLNIHTIFAKWASISKKFIASDVIATNIDISKNGLNQRFRKWINAKQFLKQLDTINVSGSTKSKADYIVHIQSKHNLLQEKFLRSMHLKLQYSPDKKNWSDDKFDFQSLKYQQQKDRKVYVRVAVKADAKPSAQSTWYRNDDTFLAVPASQAYSELKTNTTTNGVRDFKYWVNVNANELSKVIIQGNSIKLSGKKIEDSSVDNNQEKYNDVEIRYLYGGKWITKADLLGALLQLRNKFKNHKVGAPWPKIPTDFNNASVKAKWVLTSKSDSILKMGQEVPFEINTASFKTWVNIWDIQKSETKKYTTIKGVDLEFSDLIGGEGKDYDLSGTVNKVSMSRMGNLKDSVLNSHNIKLQWTVSENPNNNRDSKDWKDAVSLLEVISNVALNPRHKSLYIRFITKNVNFVASTQNPATWGNDDGIIPVRIDASKLVYEIGVHHNDLKTISVSGDTQALFQSNGEKLFLEGNFPEESKDGKSGIRYETVDDSGKIISVPKAKRKEWIKTVGLNIIYTATTTRTQGPYKIQANSKNGNKFSGTLSEFKELIKKGFNFDRSTLTMKWTSTKQGFQVSDDEEAKPNDLSKLVNVIFTTDVTKLTSKSYNLFNNTLLLKAGVNDQKLNKLPTGLKIQWSTSADPKNNAVISSNPKWLNKMPTIIPEHRSIFIRFAPVDKNYKLTSDPKIATPEQVTKLDASKVKIAVPLDKKFMDTFKKSSVDGKTYKINWKNPLAIVPDSQDGKKHGHIEYTVDDKTWHKHILAFKGMPAGETAAITNYYGKGIASLDKDLHKLKIRYVINKADKKEYIFATTAGIEMTISSLTKSIDTNSLVQPIIIDTEDKNLPIIKSTSKNMTWKYFATKAGKLKPIFVSGNKDRTASLASIKFDGNDIDQKGHSYYKLDVNKWNPKDILKRDAINALAPRHSHFEFRTIEVDPKSNPNGWSSWSKIPPKNIKTSSRFKGMQIKIVGDDGYEIPDAKTVAPQFGDQTFISDYNVIIELDVNGIKVTSATFEGFNNPQNPSARFLTDKKTGDIKKDNPLIDIVDKSGNKIPPTPEKPSPSNPDRWKGFVLEYRVKRGGTDTSWTDSNNVTKVGWHSFGQAPDSSIPWFGYVPKTLMEKDIVEYRLRARDGYLLIDDDPSLVRDKSGYVQFSHILGATQVKNLSKQIIIPKNTHIYNKDSLYNTNGDPITDDIKMPTAIFDGNEGSGTVRFDKRNFAIKDQVEIEVQVLHPISGAITSGVTSNQFAENGYYILNNKGVRTDVLTHKNNKYKWLKDSEYLEGTWQKPSAIHNLSVGDAIRVRFVAKKGYGFMWENHLNDPIKDIMFPKMYSKDAFASSQESYDVRSSVSALQTKGIPAPLPVRGLFVLPTTTPQKAKLTLSKKPTERISGNAVYSISPKPQNNAKWKWDFTIINSKGTQRHLDSIPTDLRNGDTIEITITTINSSYKLEPNYKANLKPLKFVVSGLKESIDVSSVPAPIPVIKGRVGHGVVVDIKESINNGNSYDRNNSTVLPKPKLSSKYTGYKGKGIKWQYQYSKVNPASLSEKELKALPWTDVPPKDLNNGEFIRMKLSPKDDKDIAVVKTASGKREYLYSKPGQYKNGAGVMVDYSGGWRRIEGLELNPDNIKIIHKVIGFKKEGILSAKADEKTLDGKGVIIEASYDDGKTWHDPSFFKNLNNSTPLTGTPTNNFLRFRVKPKLGYVLNPKDNNVKKGIHIYKDNKTGSWYLEKDEWKKVRIENLKEQLLVNRVSISKLIQVGKYDGDGSIKIPTLINLDTVTDRKKSTIDPVTKKPYSSYLKIKYVIKKLDSSTGQVSSESTIWNSKTPPDNLYNGDSVSAQLYVDEDNDPSTPSQFELSNKVTKSITISKLITKIKRIEKPTISFIGKSGYGSALVSPNAPRRTRWQFTVVKKAPGEFKPPADNKLIWTDQSPTDLQVGDHIKVRLINSISLVVVEQTKLKKDANGKLVPVLVKDPKTGKMVEATEKVISDWETVSGLKEIIDLSTVVIRAVDNKNLQKPNNNITKQVAFVVKGTQSGFAKVSLNKTVKNLFDINGKPIPHSDSLTWEFARQPESDKNSYSWEERSWSTSIPKNVKNGEHIFARLIIKDDPKYSDLEVYGFRPISFVVKGLTTASQISSKTSLLIIVIVGITAIIGIASGILVTIRLRKKMRL
ncbi:MAG: hypothetical protein GY679_00995 [Mycoplasma sp.]|nr:hypothetical protein [Mycoplasma sp.]